MRTLRAVVFIALALFAGLSAEAQEAKKVYRIGILAINPWSAIDGLHRGLQDLGYHEGRNLRYEYRWAEGRDDRLPALADDLAGSGVDVIVTWGTPAALAAKRATAKIPIVMGAIGDPVSVGVVSNLARPGGNITGFTTFALELEARRLELLKQLVPSITRTAVLWNPMNPALHLSLQYVRAAAAKLMVTPEVVEASDAAGVERALEAIARRGPDALMIMADPFLITQRKRIAEFAVTKRLPSVANYREFPEVGGLMAYGPDYADLFRRAAEYVDRIFKGTRPGDLPVQQPSKFEFIINLKTAKALNLTISPSLLLRADKVIE